MESPMTTRQLAKLRKSGQPFNVKFVATACGQMVIQICFLQDKTMVKKLIKDAQGNVVTCYNLSQAYAVCRSAGVRQAELIQVLPHTETCTPTADSLTNPSMTLYF